MATRKRMGRPPTGRPRSLSKQIRLHPGILEAVDVIAGEERRTRSTWIALAVERALKESGIDTAAIIAGDDPTKVIAKRRKVG
jgi:hypothetical protein